MIKANDDCPSTCKCITGSSSNGGIAPNADGYCEAHCSKSYSGKRYCGNGHDYTKGNSIDCNGCAQSQGAQSQAYYDRPAGSVCDEASHVIRSKGECTDALKALNYPTTVSYWTGHASSIPSGCSIRNGGDNMPHMEKSSSGKGKGRSDLIPICKGEAQVQSAESSECKNSGQYNDTQCSGWISHCHSGEYKQFMFDHCRKTCGLCASDSEIQNLGKDCWSQCNKKQGPCSWCGAKGMCCTMKSGWTDKSNGCDGYFGGATGHQCAIKPKCGNDAQCSSLRNSRNEAFPYCDTDDHTCKQCMSNDHCSTSKPYCVDNFCGECKTNDDCDTAHEFCQVSDHSCRSLSDLNWCCKQLHKYQVTLKSWGSLPKANRTMWNSYACGTLVGGKEKYGETCADILEGETCGTCDDPSNNFNCGKCTPGLDCEPDQEEELRPYLLHLGVEARNLPSRCRKTTREYVKITSDKHCSPRDYRPDQGRDYLYKESVRKVVKVGGHKHKVQKLSDCEGEAKKYGARYFSFTERDYKTGHPMCFYTDICVPSSERASRQAGWSIYERPADCKCHPEMFDSVGYGNCQKSYWTDVMPEGPICYVKEPSNCTDLQKAGNSQYSWEACKLRTENCNPNFVDKNGANCAKYREKKWCFPSGGYGHFWGTYDHEGGTMEDYAVNGETALVCPQCGC